MTEQEVKQNNLLIAAFMGAHINDNDKYLDGIRYMETIPITDADVQPFGGSQRDFIGTEFLKYHSSFDWLMPVVEKISDISHGSLTVNTFSRYRNGNHRCTIVSGYSFEHNNPTFKNICIDDITLLSAVYKSVIQFITWYNSKTQTNG